MVRLSLLTIAFCVLVACSSAFQIYSSRIAVPAIRSDVSMISHGKGFKRLGRPADQRKALLRGLTTEVIRHGRIRTTVVKAKEVGRVDTLKSSDIIEPIHSTPLSPLKTMQKVEYFHSFSLTTCSILALYPIPLSTSPLLLFLLLFPFFSAEKASRSYGHSRQERHRALPQTSSRIHV